MDLYWQSNVSAFYLAGKHSFLVCKIGKIITEVTLQDYSEDESKCEGHSSCLMIPAFFFIFWEVLEVGDGPFLGLNLNLTSFQITG